MDNPDGVFCVNYGMDKIIEVVNGDSIMSLIPRDKKIDDEYRLYFHCTEIIESDSSGMMYKGLVGDVESEVWIHFRDADLVFTKNCASAARSDNFI